MERTDVDTPAANEQIQKAIVCLYSQNDEPFYLQLKKSLNLLERQGQIRWLEVLAGEEHATIWQRSVQRADLILLLLSPDFFCDELCYQTMHLALQERTSRQAPVVPILARAVNWRLSSCGDLAIVPRNEQPVASWSLPDEAYACIGADLVRLVPGWPPIPVPTRSRLFQARDLPKGYVPRPKVFDEIKHLLLNRQGSQTTAITTALRGAGGFGKTTLALALCHDPEIQATFPDGILWIELGEQPPRPLDILNGILFSLEPSLSGAITIEEARDRWCKALRECVCLLVIDDVWQAEALLPLLEGGPLCLRLVTTRNDLLLPKDAARVLVDVMEPHEAVPLLCHDLPEEISLATFQPRLEALAARLGFWPLLLTLARGMLTDLVEHYLSMDEALTTIAEAYQTRGVTAFRLDNTDERQRTVEACLRVSMQHLEKFTHSHYHAIERYHELAVFPEDTDIPLATLQIYWKGSAGLEPWETKDLCRHLHRLSLLLTCDLGKNIIRLHDVLLSYLQHRAAADLPALHRRLLNAYQQKLDLKRWADLPEEEHYLWQHLVLHLCAALRTEELQATLTDLLYLTRKALYVGTAALEADLLRVRTSQQIEGVEPALSHLYRTIGRIGHLLHQAQEEASMGGLLLSYLRWELLFAEKREAMEHELPHPFLTAWHPLSDGSSALLRTLHGHTSSVTDCAVSPDGRWIVSTSSDKTFKVWDVDTGLELFSCFPDGVTNDAVSPDGRWIISAFYDILEVRDRTTGTKFQCYRDDDSIGANSSGGRWNVCLKRDGTLTGWEREVVTQESDLGEEDDLGIERFSFHTNCLGGGVNDCEVSPDGRWVVIVPFAEETLRVWDTATGTERLSLFGHTDEVNKCAVSPDGRWIVSASSDKTLKVWDALASSDSFFLSRFDREVTGCAVSPNKRFIVSVTRHGTLTVWDAATGAERLSLKGHPYHGFVGSADSPDGRWIVTISNDKMVVVEDVTTQAKRLFPSGHTDRVSNLAVSSDGRWIVTASNDGVLKVWDVGMQFVRLSSCIHTGKVLYSCAVSPNGQWIVTASHDEMVDDDDDETFDEPFKSLLQVWATATGAELFSLYTDDWVSDCAIGSDGRIIATICHDNGMFKVWDMGTEHLSDYAKEASSGVMSPDGQWIVVYDGYPCEIWDAHTGAEHLSDFAKKISGRAVSSDRRWIVTTSDDGTSKVWDAFTRAERLALSGYTGYVTGCAMSPDDRWIVTASNDGTLKVWDAHTGQCMLTFPVGGPLSGCAFHPDGEHLVACGSLGMYFLRLVM